MTLPDYHLYSANEIPVRFFPAADGATDVERWDVETGGFNRVLGFMPVILFNPSTSTHIERVSQAVFEQRVRQLRKELRSRKSKNHDPAGTSSAPSPPGRAASASRPVLRRRSVVRRSSRSSARERVDVTVPKTDFAAVLREAIEESRAAGLDVPVRELEEQAFAAHTTSSEHLGEVGEAITRFLKLNAPALPRATLAKLRRCLAEAGKVWPKYRP